MRFVCILELFLFATGELPPQAPPVVKDCPCGIGCQCPPGVCPNCVKKVPLKAPPVESGVITWHEVTWPDTSGRQAKWLVCSIPNTPWEFVRYVAPEVAAKAPFPEGIQLTGARIASTSQPPVRVRGSFAGTTGTGLTSINAPGVRQAGAINCTQFR